MELLLAPLTTAALAHLPRKMPITTIILIPWVAVFSHLRKVTLRTISKEIITEEPQM